MNRDGMLRRLRRSAGFGKVILATIAAVAIVIFIRIADEMREGDVDGIDRAIALAIHRLDTPWLVSTMVVITNLGSGLVLAIASLLVIAVCLHRRDRRLALILAVNGIVVLGLEVALKHAFGRARPTLFPEISLPGDSSFPSGHSMASMAVYGTLAVVLSTLYPTRTRVLYVVAAGLIATIGFSRIFLGVHWPSDVAAGFAAGLPFVLVARALAAQPAPIHR
jgi:membrane-associated phospholipid phosphatase